jgi:hypothetical protein
MRVSSQDTARLAHEVIAAASFGSEDAKAWGARVRDRYGSRGFDYIVARVDFLIGDHCLFMPFGCDAQIRLLERQLVVRSLSSRPRKRSLFDQRT